LRFSGGARRLCHSRKRQSPKLANLSLLKNKLKTTSNL
jgi:hypothetical protein